MTLPAFWTNERIWLGLMLSALAAMAIGAWIVLALRVLEPAPLTWKAISPPVISPTTLLIAAETDRRDEGCMSYPNIDVLTASGERKRLPVPTRTIDGALSTYQTVLAQPFAPGLYRAQLVEVVVCGSVRHEVPSPWIAFTVSP